MDLGVAGNRHFPNCLALARRIDSVDVTVYNRCGIRRVDPTHRWRGGRVAEGGGLLNRYTVISCIVGSNPIPSATSLIKVEKLGFCRRWNARYVTGDFTRLPPDCHRGVLELF